MVGESSVIRLFSRGTAAAGAPVFRHVAIVGLGSLGRTIAIATRRVWPAALVLGVDDAGLVERAIRLGEIEIGSPDPGLAGGADLVVLASNPTENAALLPALDRIVDGEAVITHLNGEPRTLFDAAHCLPPRLAFVAAWIDGSQTLWDRDAPDPNWIAGRCWRLAASPESSQALVRVRRFAAGLGASTEVLGVDELERR
jgi:prephenate dehydrogenase